MSHLCSYLRSRKKFNSTFFWFPLQYYCYLMWKLWIFKKPRRGRNSIFLSLTRMSRQSLDQFWWKLEETTEIYFHRSDVNIKFQKIMVHGLRFSRIPRFFGGIAAKTLLTPENKTTRTCRQKCIKTPLTALYRQGPPLTLQVFRFTSLIYKEKWQFNLTTSWKITKSWSFELFSKTPAEDTLLTLMIHVNDQPSLHKSWTCQDLTC